VDCGKSQVRANLSHFAKQSNDCMCEASPGLTAGRGLKLNRTSRDAYGHTIDFVFPVHAGMNRIQSHSIFGELPGQSPCQQQLESHAPPGG
jgi:hypothetical protein